MPPHARAAGHRAEQGLNQKLELSVCPLVLMRDVVKCIEQVLHERCNELLIMCAQCRCVQIGTQLQH